DRLPTCPAAYRGTRSTSIFPRLENCDRSRAPGRMKRKDRKDTKVPKIACPERGACVPHVRFHFDLHGRGAHATSAGPYPPTVARAPSPVQTESRVLPAYLSNVGHATACRRWLRDRLPTCPAAYRGTRSTSIFPRLENCDRS